jgi:hypothetical protein
MPAVPKPPISTVDAVAHARQRLGDGGRDLVDHLVVSLRCASGCGRMNVRYVEQEFV